MKKQIPPFARDDNTFRSNDNALRSVVTVLRSTWTSAALEGTGAYLMTPTILTASLPMTCRPSVRVACRRNEVVLVVRPFAITALRSK